MALVFPVTPTLGQRYPSVPTAGLYQYTWDTEKWNMGEMVSLVASAPTVVNLQAGSDTGVSSTDNVTTDSTPDFDVTADLLVGDIVKTYVDGVLYGSPHTVVLGEEGTGSTLALSLTALPDDTYAIGFTITRASVETAMSPTETVTVYAQTQRRSAVNVGLPWRSILPVPDGTMKYPDRFTVGKLYAR